MPQSIRVDIDAMMDVKEKDIALFKRVIALCAILVLSTGTGIALWFMIQLWVLLK